MLFIFLLHNTYSYKGLVYSFSPIYLRSEFPTFRDDGVEVAEGEEDALELCLLGAHLQGVLGARFNRKYHSQAGFSLKIT